MDGYPDAQKKTVNTLAVEVFLKGLREKRVAEIVFEKGPSDIFEALRYARV
jgi:hypothetical protein